MRSLNSFKGGCLPAGAALQSSPWLAALVLVLFATGCASTSAVSEPDVPVSETGPTLWSEAETVDMSAYPDAPAPRNRGVDHDVPTELLKGTATAVVLEEVDGFRIQVFASADRNEAVQAEERVRDWLASLSAERRNVLGLKENPAIYSFYKQPYYRVRIGDFRFRGEAQPVLNALKSRFSGALIVPDVVKTRK